MCEFATRPEITGGGGGCARSVGAQPLGGGEGKGGRSVGGRGAGKGSAGAAAVRRMWRCGEGTGGVGD